MITIFRKLKHIDRNEKRSLKLLALKGSFWTLGAYGTSQVLRLGNHLILAWLLAPNIFGLMALVKVVDQGLRMFSDVGIKPSIIHSKRGDEQQFLNTAWTIQIIRGFVLWGCSCILAWPFAALFGRNDPAAWQLIYLLPVAGFGAVLGGFNSTALATLNRHLHLGRITMLELALKAVSITVTIIWSLLHPTIWALVGGALVGSTFNMVVSHLILPGFRLQLGWDRDCVNELFKFGKWIFLSTVFTFLASNLDKLILGNILTLDDLGLYSIALVFAKMAQNVGVRLANTVLFPVYSRLREEPERMVAVALRSRELVLWSGIGVCICFAVGAPLFFEMLWDPRYHRAGVIAQWMAIYIWTSIVLLTIERIPLALGNSRALFIANLLRCSGAILAIGGYMIVELPGFVGGLALGLMIAHVYLLRHVPVERGKILKQGIRFTLWAMAYCIPAIAVTRWIGTTADVWCWSLAVVVLAGIPLAVSALVVWKRIRGEFGHT